jgi:hypothetical protein
MTMKKALFTLLALASITFVANAQKTLTCPYRTTPITIDGSSADWGTNWQAMDQLVNGSASTAESKFQIMFDTLNLYLVFEVTDPDMGDTSGTSTYIKDCIEVMMSLDTTSTSGISGMYQFRRVEGYNGGTGITDGAVYGSGIAIANWNLMPTCIVKEVDQDASFKYTQEWQLPWDSLKVNMDTNTDGYGMWDKKEFKLEVQCSDGSGTPVARIKQMFWFGTTNGAWNNSAYMGVVTLAKVPKVNISNSTVNDLNIYVNGNNLLISKNVSVTVYNLTGQVVSKGINTSSLNIGNLNEGIYVARIEGKSYKFYKR